MAAHGSTLRALSIPVGHGKPAVPLKSHRKCLAVSDALRLKAARQNAPLSFGSVSHLQTRQPLQNCRPCMFEQRPGRCRKSFLCDFCHLAHPNRQKVKPSPARGIWSL
ncbi:PKAR [Symbiodinium natans]|uniref:PKAR protein n=1 Tax=Symbiodinium natans TaxID=878477 RepID=A0A812M0T9_9DINO|nr:PKAR [Symbiodinium natans]